MTLFVEPHSTPQVAGQIGQADLGDPHYILVLLLSTPKHHREKVWRFSYHASEIFLLHNFLCLTIAISRPLFRWQPALKEATAFALSQKTEGLVDRSELDCSAIFEFLV
ncbi:MAG: hypothetical protein MI702_14890 [Chlorobiales bacterium]|nr:hypothetical protein [Chlorobiales bacterium]